MYYVEYGDVNENGEFIPACGDRSVFILDGRNSMATMDKDAVENNGLRRPWYKAYRICKGESFTRSKPIGDYILLPSQDTPVRTKQVIDDLFSNLFRAAMGIDEFSSLSMDAQGEVINSVGAEFIDLIMDEIRRR